MKATTRAETNSVNQVAFEQPPISWIWSGLQRFQQFSVVVDMKQLVGRKILNAFLSPLCCETTPIKVHFEVVKCENYVLIT